MRNFIKIFAVLLCLPTMLFARERQKGSVADGAFLRPMQQRDSVLIADQLRYGVRLNNVPKGTRLLLPDWKDTLTRDVEVVRPWQMDTISVHKQGKGLPDTMDLEAYMVITSFEEGLYDLPGIFMVRWAPDGVVDTLAYSANQLVVTTIPVDTATFVVHEIKDQVRYPVTFREVLPYILAVLLAAGLIALAVWFIIRQRRKKAGEEASRKEPAHIVALREIDKWRGDKFWEPSQQKAFYSGVTDALRGYIDARYGISAMEMTTQELFDALKGTDVPGELKEPLKDLFERADFVKFAKHSADREENAGVIPLAVRFVTSTYQVEVEDEAASEKNEHVN
ncbi:MAG: hypothetical protein KBT05_07365 [Bacteroidales bacterium]|nr:hypothetical protein [Candidatus Cryptobacteroides caccocaballi]